VAENQLFEKTKPISEAMGLSAYDARDCHGPAGLAMTALSLFLRASVALWLWGNYAKQSQFSGVRRCLFGFIRG